MAQRQRRVPVKAQTELEQNLRSPDMETRLAAIQNLVTYLNETLNPSNIDYRYFPVLRVQREMRDRSVEGPQNPGGIDMRYFPVLRMRKRLDTVFGYVPSLIARLGDSDPQVRGAAAYTLGLIGDNRAYSELQRLSTSDPNEIVRSIATTSLNLMPRP